MPVELQTDLSAEIAALRTAIDRAADATSGSLRELLLYRDGDAASGASELTELDRQLGALRARVAMALRRGEGPSSLRAELATLLSFATTLRADAEACVAAFEEARRGIERREQAARAERERVAAVRGALVRLRDALQAEIDRTAAQMARDAGGESRRTVPVFTLAPGVTVCSAIVIHPPRRFHFDERWLLTLDDTRHHVVIRRSYT